MKKQLTRSQLRRILINEIRIINEIADEHDELTDAISKVKDPAIKNALELIANLII